MSWLDALLGRIKNAGTLLDISGALNFQNGLTATRNEATDTIDIETDVTAVFGGTTVAPEVDSDVVVTSAGTTAYSFVLPEEGYKYNIRFIVEAKEQNDDINYTHIAYIIAWNNGGTAQIIGSPILLADRAHDSSGVSATVQFTVAYTESDDEIVATLTNSTNNSADVNVYATAEAMWLADP